MFSADTKGTKMPSDTSPAPCHKQAWWLPVLSLPQPMHAVGQGGDRDLECLSSPQGEQGFRDILEVEEPGCPQPGP